MKSTETLVFKLAKLLTAISWADGEFDNTELNVLKNLLFTIPELTGEEWAELEIYMDSPVLAAEREVLLAEVVSAIRSAADKDLVLRSLHALMAADGTITKEEQRMFDEFKAAVDSKATGLLGLLSNLAGGMLTKRAAVDRAAVTRESELEVFTRNKILYELNRDHPGFADISADKLKKLCCAGALLGRVAMTDGVFCDKEYSALVSILESEWDLPGREAKLLGGIVRNRVADGLDYHYLTHSFYDQTTSDERRQFVKLLFAMANSAGNTSYEEIEEIRRISQSLKVGHRDFIDAKLTISRADRDGL